MTAVSVLGFVSSLVGHLAWPLVSLAALLLLREEARGLVKRMLRAEVAGAKLFFKEAEDARDLVNVVVDAATDVDSAPASTHSDGEVSDPLLDPTLPPSAAVMIAWSEFDRDLQRAAGPQARYRRPEDVVQRLAATGRLPADLVPVVRSLRRLRNEVVHSEASVDSAGAREFVLAVRGLQEALRLLPLSGEQSVDERR